MVSSESDDESRKLGSFLKQRWSRNGTSALGSCVQKSEVAPIFSACWGFNPACVSTSTLAFWSWLNLLCLFIYLFDWTNHGQRGLWVKLVKFGCFQSAVDKKTGPARSQRQMDRSSGVLTFRRLLLDVRSCQVPVDQRRLTAGKVTHNALGDGGLIKLESGICETGLRFVWITHHFQFWNRPAQRPLLTVHKRICRDTDSLSVTVHSWMWGNWEAKDGTLPKRALVCLYCIILEPQSWSKHT